MRNAPLPANGNGNVLVWLRLLLIASILCPVLLFLYAAALNYRYEYDAARVRIARMTDILYAHTDKVLDTHELMLKQLVALFEGMSNASIGARADALQAKLKELMTDLPQIQDISLVSETGRMMVDVDHGRSAIGEDVSGTEFFRDVTEKVGHTAGPFLAGRWNDRQLFSLAMRRLNPDGSFAGVIAVWVNPAYFEQFFARALVDQALGGDSLALMRSDGEMLVRWPSTRLRLREGGSVLLDDIDRAPEAGIVEAIAMSDGRFRLISYRKVPDYPLYVLSAMPRSVVMETWIASLVPHLIFGIPATIGLFSITLLALRRTRAMAAEQDRRRIAEAALHQAQKMEAVGQLTGGVAHDFNNLLTAIIGNLDLIQRRTSDPNVQRLAGSAQRAAERGSKLTGALLAFSRRQNLSTEIIDLNALVRDFAVLGQRALPETMRLELKLDPDNPYCQADAAQLESALLNLVINARDAMEKNGGTVTISTAEMALGEFELAGNSDAHPGRFAAIAVSDSGVGMSPEIQARAFEPFFTTKEFGRGSGLGLSQVYGYVHQTGGHVAIKTRAGIGTTVTLCMPLAVVADRAKAARGSAIDQAHPPSTILLVEDDPDVREVTAGALRETGYRVIAAEDGHEALAALAGAERIDLLFSDMIMPHGINGVELARRARTVRPGLPVLLTSGYAGSTLARQGLVEGEFEIIGKPFRHADLVARITSAIAASPSGAVAARGDA
jgi:two-component system, NtrC family, sensor kinase